MGQLGYAQGRLGAIAVEVRGCCEQLSSDQEPRQNALMVQKQISLLRESALLFEELNLSKVAAYTMQLGTAITQLKLSEDTREKLVKALADWLAYIKPILPMRESSTVTATVIGRQMNNVRMGYYPTEPTHVAHIKRALAFPNGNTANLLDPCCGEGNALAQLGDGQASETYGAELDESRAAAAQEKLHHIAMGSYYFSCISRSAFHLLFLNPPYLQLYGGARSEKRFLAESYDHLMMGGVLVYIIPYYRLTEDVCRFLAAHFDKLMAYRFCGTEFEKFRQVAVFGVRKPRKENTRMMRLLEMASLHPDRLPPLDQIPTGCYPLPDMEKVVTQFRGARFNVQELAEQMQCMGSLLPKRGIQNHAEKRPPLPLTIGQIGLVGGSGLINGLIACDTPHVLKGRVIKTTQRRTGESYEDINGSETTEIIETTSNKMVFNVLTPQGVKLLA